MSRGPKGEKRPANVIGGADLAEMVDEALTKPGKRGRTRSGLRHDCGPQSF